MPSFTTRHSFCRHDAPLIEMYADMMLRDRYVYVIRLPDADDAEYMPRCHAAMKCYEP